MAVRSVGVFAEYGVDGLIPPIAIGGEQVVGRRKTGFGDPEQRIRKCVSSRPSQSSLARRFNPPWASFRTRTAMSRTVVFPNGVRRAVLWASALR